MQKPTRSDIAGLAFIGALVGLLLWIFASTPDGEAWTGTDLYEYAAPDDRRD